MNTRFGRAFRYEVRNYFRAVAILWLVMALIPAAMLAITYFLAGETAMEGSFNGYSIAVGMFGLVLGMVGLRENQRVLNQNGVSRRSAFLADVAALAVAAVLVAAGVTVIMGAYQTVLGGQGRLLITDLYQVIYEGPSAGAGIGGLVRGAIFSAAVGWMLAALGQFCSALYWRLNKFWTILISVTVPLVLIFGSVPLISWAGHHLRRAGGGGGPGGFRTVPGRIPLERGGGAAGHGGGVLRPQLAAAAPGHDPACKVTDKSEKIKDKRSSQTRASLILYLISDISRGAPCVLLSAHDAAVRAGGKAVDQGVDGAEHQQRPGGAEGEQTDVKEVEQLQQFAQHGEGCRHMDARRHQGQEEYQQHLTADGGADLPGTHAPPAA